MTFDAGTTTDEVVEGKDLAGQTIVVTGATSGLGKESARVLARAGARVVLCGRNDEKGRAVADEIGAGAEFHHLELADLDAVRSSADELLSRIERLDVLVNNAGVMACPLDHTADGFEMQFGTNHLGHFLFTARLFPLLMASVPSRIVNLSSHGHMIGGVDLDDPNYERREYEKWNAYGQAKTANVLFSRELERRFGEHGLHAYAVHPGMIVTELGRHLVAEDFEFIGERTKDRPAGGPSSGFKSVEAGAATQVWAATADDIPGGAYLADVAVCEQVAPWATDDEAAAQLWALSEQLVGEPFPSWD
jgi:NAD(P)-dependent dehydrogenase (short-subunit alcohol dehydrogenase family)